MKVRWIKALDGLGGQEAISAPNTAAAASAMRAMWNDIGGADDEFLAIFATTKCPEPRHYRGLVCGFAQLKPVEQLDDLRRYASSFAWNQPERWGIGVPCFLPWKAIPDTDLDIVNRRIRWAVGDDVWRSVCYAFRTGAPRPIDNGQYAPIAYVLSSYVNKNYERLPALENSGDHGVSPGGARPA